MRSLLAFCLLTASYAACLKTYTSSGTSSHPAVDQITIQFDTDSFRVPVNTREHTVEYLKERIESKCFTAKEYQVLYYDRQMLRNGELLANYGILPGDTITMKVKTPDHDQH